MFVERMEQISMGLWGPQVAAFLKRPPTLGFLVALVQESGKTVAEAVFVFLAAIRYLDQSLSAGVREDDILSGTPREVSLELFLVRHQERLWHLCLGRRVLTNLPERGLPVLEALAGLGGDHDLRVLEAGCSCGLIGRVLRNAPLVTAQAERLFAPGQQLPRELARVVDYLGFDPEAPDSQWLLCCVPGRVQRERLRHFLQVVPESPPFALETLALSDFRQHPAVKAFAAPGQASRLVLLTSFVLYQVPEAGRLAITDSIRQFVQDHAAVWVNLDAVPAGDHFEYVLELDGRPVLMLENDLAQRWRPVGRGSHG